MLALDFLLPDQTEPVELATAFAFGIRSYGGKAGQHWFLRPGQGGVPPFLEGIRALRVLVPKDEHCYQAALFTLTAIDVWCLRAARQGRLRSGRGSYPPLYESGIRYGEEPPGQEQWLSTDALYQLGVGDCEDLACARASERLTVGDHCSPCMELQPANDEGHRLYHILICNPDGTREDPSERLGMP